MRPIKRAIVLCWIMLVACFAIKLFGGNWFEVACTNEHFSMICGFVDERLALQNAIALILYVLSTTIIMLSSARAPSPTKKQLAFLVVCVSSIWALQYLSLTAKAVVEMSFFLFCPFLLNLVVEKRAITKRAFFVEILFGAIGIALTWAFQLLSLITRNFGVSFVGDETLVALILMVDYYIMIVLYYLYVKSKEGGNKDG